MYIEPSTIIELFPAVPLEPSYTHTLYWNSIIDQNSYFDNYYNKRTFRNFTYQRDKRGFIRLPLTMGLSYGVYNYMRFKNEAFENKWFYAFIISMEYISNDVLQIQYEIDVMQTWYFNPDGTHGYILNKCMVLREHSARDDIGDNLIAEDLETGDYITCDVEEIMQNDFHNYAYAILASQGPDGTQPYGGYAGMFYGTYFKIFTSYTEFLAELEAFKNGVTASLEPIIAIYQMPLFMASVETRQKQYTASKTQWRTSFGGYVPKNNKLFTYPYSFMTLMSPDGNNVTLKYEDFDLGGNTITFDIYGAAYPMPECLITPANYQGVANEPGRPVFINYAVTMSKFPTCAVSSDAFSAWWAQNKTSMIVGAVSDTISAGVGGLTTFGEMRFSKRLGRDLPADILTGGKALSSLIGGTGALMAGSALNAGISALSTAAGETAQILAARKDHKAVPDSVVGVANANAVLSAYTKYSCDLCYQQIRSDYAWSIDNYFTMYGYAVKRLKTPLFEVRPHWNYIQTSGCTINGNVPGDDERKICSIFDNGITFWKNPEEVGDYSLDNSPV